MVNSLLRRYYWTNFNKSWQRQYSVWAQWLRESKSQSEKVYSKETAAIAAINFPIERCLWKIVSCRSFYRFFAIETCAKRVNSCQTEVAEKRQSSAPSYDRTPFYARILVSRELYKSEDRACLHIELDIENSGLNYEAGDHAVIYPTNNEDLVSKLEKLCKIETEDAAKYRFTLLHNLEITAIPTQHIIKELVEYCSHEKDKEFLARLTNDTPLSKANYESWIINDGRNILHILEDIKSCRPPLLDLCKLLPRLQPRYYSISSSSKLHPDRVHITAVIVEYKTKTGRLNKGVATTYLQTISKLKATKIPILISKSKFHLVENTEKPIIMVAAGTGLAPFRGFIQERQYLRDRGKTVGETVLYFGCRKRKEDFIYGDELVNFVEKGTLTLKTAFSRDQQEKVYVTNLLQQDADLIWQLLDKHKAHFYICGAAKNLAADVRNTLMDIIARKGNLNEAQALDYLKKIEAENRYSADVWG